MGLGERCSPNPIFSPLFTFRALIDIQGFKNTLMAGVEARRKIIWVWLVGETDQPHPKPRKEVFPTCLFYDRRACSIWYSSRPDDLAGEEQVLPGPRSGST